MEPEAKNTLFPVFLKLENFRVLIVGGGKIGLEKVSAILNNSPATQLTLVATHVSEEIKALRTDHSNLLIHQRSFKPEDLENIDFAVVAVNNKVTSSEIRNLAKQKNILVNVADTPEQCDFYLGSIVQKGYVKIAVSTNGKSPTIARRIRETLDEAFPAEINESIENLSKVRRYLSGDFSEKVKQLNTITAVLSKEGIKKPSKISRQRFWIYTISVPALLITGYFTCHLLPPDLAGGHVSTFVQSLDDSFPLYVLAGFVAQMIDGALGMAYGITATTFLLSIGISPAMSSASVHTSEVFTSGVSGLMHLKFGNVNTKLFRSLLIPGILGAIIGAYILSSCEDYNYVIKPVVSTYTLVLGLIIIFKALNKDKLRRKIRNIFPLALVGGFLDSIGGGGWGPIVASTLIARGRTPRYTLGSVNLAEFFITLASSVTFITVIGLTHFSIILGLVTGGVIAAPIAAYFTNKLPAKFIMVSVGIVVIILSIKRLLF